MIIKKKPFEIDSKLRNKETGQIVILKKYGTQIAMGLDIKTSRSITKQKQNFNFFYGKDIETDKNIKGKTTNFEVIKD